MNKIEPGIGISRRYLHDEVAERMRELIRSGEMEPKARINEGELTERFGISRTPLREAIKILATEGLLELLPNRGARVASISDGELEEMMEVIAGLEATAGDLACRLYIGGMGGALSHQFLLAALGFDPVLRRDLWQQFRELAAAGTTLLVSSHVMEEAERCDRLLLLRQGELLADETPATLRARTGCERLDDAFLALVEGDRR